MVHQSGNIPLEILARLCLHLPPISPRWPPRTARPPLTLTHPLLLRSCCSIFLPNTCISHLRSLLYPGTGLKCSSSWVCTGEAWVRITGSQGVAFGRAVFLAEQSVLNDANLFCCKSVIWNDIWVTIMELCWEFNSLESCWIVYIYISFFLCVYKLQKTVMNSSLHIWVSFVLQVMGVRSQAFCCSHSLSHTCTRLLVWSSVDTPRAFLLLRAKSAHFAQWVQTSYRPPFQKHHNMFPINFDVSHNTGLDENGHFWNMVGDPYCIIQYIRLQ